VYQEGGTELATIEEQIKELEEQISNTKYNKATEAHIGKLKAKIAKLTAEEEKRRSSKGSTKGFYVKKAGNATVALVGFPSVGKSTLLNQLTGTKSETGAYHFTTLDVVPGVLEYNHAKIQILDMPGLIKDASRGKGRGREVIAAARASDVILFVVDIFNPDISVLFGELYNSGIRLDQSKPDVVITPTGQGGIQVKPTLKLTKITEDTIKDMTAAYGHINATVVVREDITVEQMLDVLAGNRVYIKSLMAINKMDLAEPGQLEAVQKMHSNYQTVPVSAATGQGMEDLKQALYDTIDMIRVYLKPQGQEADMDIPLIIKRGNNVGDVCELIHRDFRNRFRYAMVWGDSAKFPGQTVGLEHVLMDKDILSVIVKR
jgi:small GTP-binding protein